MSQSVKKLVHQFTVSDYDIKSALDKEIDSWRETEKGCWVIKNSIGNPTIHQYYNQDFVDSDICVTFLVVANFTEDDAVYYTLKWG